MADVFTDMDKILKNEVVERHTFYQLKFFVLGSEPTVQAKLQCCLRELKARRLTLESISREVEDLRDHNALLGFEIERVEGEIATDDKGIDLLDRAAIDRFEQERDIELRGIRRRTQANQRQILELQKKFQYTSEECQFFITAFNQLNGEQELRSWDDLDVQKEYWNAKLDREFRTRLLLGQPLDSELVKAIERLHDDAPAKQAVLQLVQRQEAFNREHGLPATTFEVAGESNSGAERKAPGVMLWPDGVFESLTPSKA